VSCQLLADELARNCALKSLVLDFNPIGDTGASILAQGLKRHSVLSTLKLAYCGITSAAAQPIADGLIQGSKIKILDLKGNRLGIHTAREGVSELREGEHAQHGCNRHSA
jgi:Ran GTPase-activating protein (RanGAP) involved in mRNA processing and transport